MKKLQKGIIVFLACACALAIVVTEAAAQQQAAEQKIVLRLQSAFAAVLPALGECLPFFKEYVDAASGGSIEVKYFDPGKLVPAFEIHDAVSSGKIEAGYTAPVYLAGKLPATELFSSLWGEFQHRLICGNSMAIPGAYKRRRNLKRSFQFTSARSSRLVPPGHQQEDLKGMAIRYPGLPGG
jgi:TRAP-type C4-dicarboxylate transport system substrate-binding protein